LAVPVNRIAGTSDAPVIDGNGTTPRPAITWRVSTSMTSLPSIRSPPRTARATGSGENAAVQHHSRDTAPSRRTAKFAGVRDPFRFSGGAIPMRLCGAVPVRPATSAKMRERHLFCGGRRRSWISSPQPFAAAVRIRPFTAPGDFNGTYKLRPAETPASDKLAACHCVRLYSIGTAANRSASFSTNRRRTGFPARLERRRFPKRRAQSRRR
jgi:hypothetical protein